MDAEGSRIQVQLLMTESRVGYGFIGLKSSSNLKDMQ